MDELDPKKIEEILIVENYISKKILDRAQSEAKKYSQNTLEYILGTGLITKNLLGQAISEYYNVQYADLELNEPTSEEIQNLPEETARKYQILIYRTDETNIFIAAHNPKNEQCKEELIKLWPDKTIQLFFAFQEDIERLYSKYKKSLETRFSQLLKSTKEMAPEILDEIIKDALDYRASDIHFEPREKDVVIRFRVDSVLHEAGKIALNHYDTLLNRVKVKADIRTDEHFKPQDGAIRQEKDGKHFDLRISILPTLNGEKIVIRILSEYIGSLAMSSLGLPVQLQELIHKVLNKQYGTIIITGPTGSGKTTTLYSILRLLNSPTINITTIEDPVEYRVGEINQIQVDEKTGLTFANGLRSIVRQDPNVILVGEIRDEETADIAVNAALSGHLLLTTFHANDSSAVIPRLIDMNIKPYLLSSTLDVIVTQRLVRKICDNCRISENVSKADIEKSFPDLTQALFTEKEKSLVLYHGKGCKSCNNTGYKGRIALFEYFRMTKEIKNQIITNPSAQNIFDLAKKQGMTTFLDDGVDKVKKGLTTISELSRVAGG